MKDNWMIGLQIDPPSGWRYGFPKTYNPLPGEDFRSWLIRMGYPVKDVNFAMKYSRVIG